MQCSPGGFLWVVILCVLLIATVFLCCASFVMDNFEQSFKVFSTGLGCGLLGLFIAIGCLLYYCH